jgi:uncharacterized phage protein (TIGR01671 family)
VNINYTTKSSKRWGMMMNKYRIWCNYHKTWEIHDMALLPSGDLIDLKTHKISNKDHIIARYTGLKDNFEKELYEYDIVEVLAERLPYYENYPQSKFDIKYIIRCVVVFKDFQWSLDYKNKYNDNLLELRGKEIEKRDFRFAQELGNYFFFQKEHRSHEWNNDKNKHCDFHRIKRIGSKHENPELLKGNV